MKTGLDPRLMLVTDPHLCDPRGVVDTIRQAVAGGVTVVQVRDKEASTRGLLALLGEVARAVEAPVLVNDRVDVFLAARATGAPVAGVHVGQSDLPVGLVRRLVGPDAILGLTAHLPAHLAEAATLPTGTINYLGVGAYRATATKPDHPAPLGPTGLAEVCAATDLPCVAIGGITTDDLDPIRTAGAAGVAAVSAICAATSPQHAARAFTKEWQ